MDKIRLTTNEMILKLISKVDMLQGDHEVAASLITETCTKFLGADRVTLWMKTAKLHTYCSLDSYDTSTRKHDKDETIVLDGFMNFIGSLSSERYLVIESVQTDSRTVDLIKDVWKNLNITSMLIVPIFISAKYQGFIQCNYSETTTFTQDKIMFVVQVADLFSQVMLTHQLNTISDKKSLMERLSLTPYPLTTTPFDLLTLLTSGLDLVGAQSGMIFRTDPSHRQIRCLASLNTAYDMVGLRLNYGEDAAGIAAETNMTVLVDDYHTWSKVSSVVQSGIIFKSMLAVPIPGKKTAAGVLVASGKKDNLGFTLEDQSLLELFVQQISYQLEHATLTDTITQLHRKDDLINRFSSIRSQVNQIDRMLMLSASLLQTGLPADIVLIRAGDISAMSGMDQSLEHEVQNRIQAIASFNVPIYIDDWRSYNGTLSEMASTMDKLGIRSSILAPIRLQKKNAGYIAVNTHQVRHWRDEEVSAVSAAAEQVERDVEYFTMQEQLLMQDQIITRIRNTSENLNRLFSYDEATEMTGREAMDILKADGGAIFLRNPDGSVTTTWHSGIPAKKLDQILSTESQDISQFFMTATIPTTITDFTMPGFPIQMKRFLEVEKIHTVQTIPLLYSGQIVGLVMLFFQVMRTSTANEMRVLETFSNQASLTLQNAWMFDQIEKGYIQVALALAQAMDERDMMVSNSSIRIATWAEQAADKLGLPEEEIRDLHWAALLHDIGKVAVPENVLHKSGKLAKEDWAYIHQHPVKGEEIVQPVTRFRSVGRIIRNMREHFDGSGYPDRLKGTEIPMTSRILSVADAYESMLSDRPYQKARTTEEALLELEKGSGRQFDPFVVQTFVDTIQNKKKAN